MGKVYAEGEEYWDVKGIAVVVKRYLFDAV